MNTTLANSARSAGRLSLLAAAIWGSTLAGAADSGWYMGANGGQSMAKIDTPRIASGLLGSGFTSALVSDHNRETSYKLFGGYQLSPLFAVEGGFFDLGQFGFDATTVPPGTLKGNIRLRGANIDLVGSWPITSRWSVLGRVGANHTQARDTFTGTGAVVVLNPSPSAFDTHPKLGLGLQYALNESLSIRAEAERYRINDAIGNKGDIDLVSVGLVYRFGAK